MGHHSSIEYRLNCSHSQHTHLPSKKEKNLGANIGEALIKFYSIKIFVYNCRMRNEDGFTHQTFSHKQNKTKKNLYTHNEA